MADFKNLFSDLFDLEDNMDKYQWIIEYGASARYLEHKYHTENNMVKGCTSNLWLARDSSGQLAAHGESHIVHGIASMICDYYNQATEQQKQELGVGLLESLGLNPLLSMGRQNGVANLIAKIKAL